MILTLMRRMTRGAARLESPPLAPAAPGWWRGRLAQYAGAVAFVALAAGLRLTIAGVAQGEIPFFLQFVAVVASAVLGGLGPGLLATALGAVAGYYLSHASGGAARMLGPEVRLFLLEGALISGLGAWLHAARRRAQSADIASAALEKQMLDVGDNERRRFGHDLHDGLGQQLTGIALLSESLAHSLAQQGSAHAGQAHQAGRIAELVSETIGRTRELARGLSPLTLESDGLAAALEELASRATRLFNIDARWDCEHARLPVADESAVHVYRIVQEAVSNSVKHGKARRVRIRGSVTRDTVTVTVEDDGSGLSAKTVAEPGIGLRIMQYRAKLIGATLSVARATQAGGTIVTCALPTDGAVST
jgi:signal transduction histidine kinase